MKKPKLETAAPEPLRRRFIVLGDTTTHCGTVISAWGEDRWTIDGSPVACVGDRVICPKCHGVYTITEGADDTILDGKPVACEGHRVSCGAELVSVSQLRAKKR